VVGAEPWEEVLEWWLGDARRDPEGTAAKKDLWWRGGAEVDRRVRERFAPLLERAARGELDAWKETAHGALALILLFDQVPRNVHRGSREAFAYDDRALALARELIDAGRHTGLSPIEQVFLRMPLEHAEDLALQERCVAEMEQLARTCEPRWRTRLEGFADFARRHRDVIARFGRFPHRNAALGRTSTKQEEAWLKDGERFGQ
jgi:uncharacterized protein (DUF924 family)